MKRQREHRERERENERQEKYINLKTEEDSERTKKGGGAAQVGKRKSERTDKATRLTNKK